MSVVSPNTVFHLIIISTLKIFNLSKCYFGAVVYGNGTRGGVVNIITKIPSKDSARIVLKV